MCEDAHTQTVFSMKKLQRIILDDLRHVKTVIDPLVRGMKLT